MGPPALRRCPSQGRSSRDVSQSNNRLHIASFYPQKTLVSFFGGRPELRAPALAECRHLALLVGQQAAFDLILAHTAVSRGMWDLVDQLIRAVYLDRYLIRRGGDDAKLCTRDWGAFASRVQKSRPEIATGHARKSSGPNEFSPYKALQSRVPAGPQTNDQRSTFRFPLLFCKKNSEMYVL